MSLAQQPYDPSGGVDLNLPIRAVNRSDAPVTWKYARVDHILQPGVSTFVPYMAMVYYQGDPRSIDKPGRPMHEQYRRNEYERLHIVHGVYENTEQWANVPIIDCYPIDSDIPFNTVLRDPTGANMSDQAHDEAEISLMRRSMEEMANQLRIMQAQVASRESAEAAISRAGIDPDDLDRQATTERGIVPDGQSMLGEHPIKKSATAKARPKPGEGPSVTKDE